MKVYIVASDNYEKLLAERLGTVLQDMGHLVELLLSKDNDYPETMKQTAELHSKCLRFSPDIIFSFGSKPELLLELLIGGTPVLVYCPDMNLNLYSVLDVHSKRHLYSNILLHSKCLENCTAIISSNGSIMQGKHVFEHLPFYNISFDVHDMLESKDCISYVVGSSEEDFYDILGQYTMIKKSSVLQGDNDTIDLLKRSKIVVNLSDLDAHYLMGYGCKVLAMPTPDNTKVPYVIKFNDKESLKSALEHAQKEDNNIDLMMGYMKRFSIENASKEIEEYMSRTINIALMAGRTRGW